MALENDLFAPTVTIQEDVAAGQTYTIPISLVAPALPGNYPVKWHVEGPGGVYGKITHTVGVYGPACEPPEESTGRFSITLDDESPVVVDNASSFSRTQVTRLVKQADRSTRSACVEEPAKGLFSQGDRVLVRDSYLAWFDLTTGDGVQFASRDSTPPGPYSNDWERAGELAGFWALDAQQADFRYKSVQDGCTWPRNQLIPGSASATGANSHGDEFWWDQYAPPTEQCVGIGEGLASDMQRFFCHHYAKAAPMGEWRVTLDGMRDDAGSVHYRTRAFMANGLPPLPREGELGRSIDISDGIDQDKIQALLDSSVEYVGAADGIHVIWKVRPLRADVTLTNVFMDHFATYAQDEDGLSFVEEGKQQTCDPGGSSEQWPTAAFGLPMFHLSSGTMYGNYPATAIPSGVVGVLQLGPACPSGDPYYLNPGLYVDALPGTWLAIGEDPAVLASQRRLVITLPSDASTGDGTEASPRPIPWITMGSYNETRDGALDFGVIRGGPDVTMTMAENNWYVGEYCLSADYSCSPEPPSRPAVRVTHSGECAFGIGCSVTFAATGTAQDGSAVTYAWSGCGSATDAAVVCDKPSSGLVAATVAVTDGHGQVTSAPDSANVYASGFSTGEWSTCTVNGAWICTASGSGGCTRQGTQTRTVTETSWTLEPTAAVASPVSSQSCTETTTGYVTSYIASYDAAWSCTAVGANGCYKNRLSYAASSFVPTSPDAAVPPERLYANGYVATYTTTYAATWTCTASGANGCYKTRLSYSPAAYKVEGPDASVPEDRIYTYGYVATWYAGDWSACTATACNTTGYYNRVVSPATWKPDPPDAPEPQGALACSYECNYTCEDYGLYSTWADCYGAGWSYCGTRYRDDGHGGLLTCRQGYE